MFWKKKGIVPNSNWRELEKVQADDMKKRNPDYKIQTQKVYRGYGKRPDIYGQHKTIPHKRIGGESKCVKELTSKNVKQAKSYKKHPGYLSSVEIGVCKETKVTHKVRKEAKDSGMKVKRYNVKREKSWWQI
ncbi:MAG: hypothetical protein HOD60_11400 [Candidatus Nitrosopelagicus sp.]|jgi:hypothetical protein|nr:hypothetical protein [Candidatus Nitrosopelagicus sp.]